METYKLKALNCFIGGKIYKKEDNVVFDLINFPKEDVLKAFNEGFLVKISEKIQEIENKSDLNEQTKKVLKPKKDV